MGLLAVYIWGMAAEMTDQCHGEMIGRDETFQVDRAMTGASKDILLFIC